MGKNTKNFRQTAQSRSSNSGAQGYSQINRQGNWYGKIRGLFTVKGKSKQKI